MNIRSERQKEKRMENRRGQLYGEVILIKIILTLSAFIQFLITRLF